MCPASLGLVPGATSGLRRISLNPAHFRSGRWLLLAEGLLVGALGGAGLVSAGVHTGAGRAGVPVLGLTLTPAQSGLLLGFAVLAVLAAGHRRAALIITGVAAAAFLVLMLIGGVAAAYDTPGPFGFTPRGILLHGPLAAVNLALLMWLVPDTMEGPTWVKCGPQDRLQRVAPMNADSGVILRGARDRPAPTARQDVAAKVVGD